MGVRAAQGSEPLSAGFAIAAILKGTIGAGVLTLPYVFSKVNLLFACLGMVVLALINFLGVWNIIVCNTILAHSEGPEVADGTDQDPEEESEYSDDAEHIPCTSAGGDKDYGLGPMALVGNMTCGMIGVVLAGIGILGSQLGVLIAYCDVIFETTKTMTSINHILLRLILLVTTCALSLVRELGMLAKLSIAALLVYAVIGCFLIYFGTVEISMGNHLPDNKWLPVKWDGFSMWYGTSIFSFEGIVIAQYVYQDMRIPLGEEARFKVVAGISWAISCFVFIFCGMYGYLAYGTDLKDVFYLNFPNPYKDIASIVLILILLQSFMLNGYPVFAFLDDVLLGVQSGGSLLEDGSGGSDDDKQSDATDEGDEQEEGETSASCRKAGRVGASIAIRCLTVCAINFTAIVIPNVAKMTGFSGSVFMSLVAFILPAIFHAKLKLFKLTVMEWILDLVLLICGIAAMVLGVTLVVAS